MAESNAASVERSGGHKIRPWVPRFWDGMTVPAWIRLAAENRFRIAPQRWPMGVIVSASSTLNSFLAGLQTIVYGRRIARAKIHEPPVFIIGHWRSGTTLLHELLICDSRHTYPDTYACFAPSHFLLSRYFMRPALSFLLPDRRPMDNMQAGWDHPQEEEFALCNLGVPSPYLFMAFPNSPKRDQEYLDLAGVGPEALRRWQEALVWFLKCVTVASPKRIILKSPPHTCRMRVLTELFPGARFIHIHRDPYVVFPSTVNLWKRLCEDQGFQIPRHDGLEEYVFETFRHMYEVFERDRTLLGPSQLCDVSYEQLVADPLGQLRRIYQELELGDFENVRAAAQAYLASQSDYQKNRYRITPELREQISRRWASFIANYGYGSRSAEPEAA